MGELAVATSHPPRAFLRFLRPVRKVVPGGQGERVLGGQHPLLDGQQGGVLVAGPGRIPRLPGPQGEVGPGEQGRRVLRAGHPLADGQQGGELVPGPAASPATPVQRARLARAFRVAGCSGPSSRSSMGSRAAATVCPAHRDSATRTSPGIPSPFSVAPRPNHRTVQTAAPSGDRGEYGEACLPAAASPISRSVVTIARTDRRGRIRTSVGHDVVKASGGGWTVGGVTACWCHPCQGGRAVPGKRTQTRPAAGPDDP
jgi:hypothetical protein